MTGGGERLGEVSGFTCPECHGGLWKMHEGGILRFRCRAGHAYTVQSLLADLSKSIEVMLWNAVRGIEESVALIHHIAEHLQEHGQGSVSEKFLTQAQEAERRAD